MADNPPRGSPRVVARLAYDDVRRAIDFLHDAFGFSEHREARLENGDWILTDIQVVDSLIMIGTSGPHGLVSPRQTAANTQALIVYVDQIDEHYERAKSAGVQIVSDLEDMFWGDRRYEALDCEGHAWSFHEHLRDIPREDWKM